MVEKVKPLVFQLQDILKYATKYPDVNNALADLREYVQDTKASKAVVEDRLKKLEDMLTKKSEKKKPFTDHLQKIRKAMQVDERATPTGSKSKEWNRSNLTHVEETTKLSGRIVQNDEQTHSPSTSERASPMPGQTKENSTLRSDLTQVEETTELSGRIDENDKEDISRLKTENQYLRKTLDGLYKYIIGGDETELDLKAPKNMKDNQSSVEVEANVKEVKKKFQETKTDLLECKQEMARKKKEYEQNYEKLRAEHQKLKTAYTNLEKRCNDTNVLSEHAGALLTHDNPSIADLSDPNRPTKLAEKYSELYDNQWTDAFATIAKEDPDISENNIIRYLYGMLVDGYRFCEDVRRKQILALEDILFDPAGGMKTSQRRQKEEMSQRIAKHFNDISNLSSNVTSENLAKAFVMEEKTKDKYSKLLKPCETYIQECVQLCWLMQVQTPPLRLDVTTIQGQSFDKDCYKEYRRRGKEIAFVVWPALFLHETGPVMSKGVAQGQ